MKIPDCVDDAPPSMVGKYIGDKVMKTEITRIFWTLRYSSNTYRCYKGYNVRIWI